MIALSLVMFGLGLVTGGITQFADGIRLREWQRAMQYFARLKNLEPNRPGIDALLDELDWFIQLHEPPYPGYQYNGQNLSFDNRVGLYIEDGYWNHRDAAVVFKRVDHETGDTKYIYHGNDGTHMPWNDTAQLASLCQISPRAVQKQRARRNPQALAAAQLCLGDRRLLCWDVEVCSPNANLEGRPSWGRASRFAFGELQRPTLVGA